MRGGVLNICKLDADLNRTSEKLEFDDIVELDEDEVASPFKGGVPPSFIMFTFTLLRNGCYDYRSIMLSSNSVLDYSNKSYVIYGNKKYTGCDGFKQLKIVLEQEKVAKLLDAL